MGTGDQLCHEKTLKSLEHEKLHVRNSRFLERTPSSPTFWAINVDIAARREVQFPGRWWSELFYLLARMAWRDWTRLWNRKPFADILEKQNLMAEPACSIDVGEVAYLLIVKLFTLQNSNDSDCFHSTIVSAKSIEPLRSLMWPYLYTCWFPHTQFGLLLITQSTRAHKFSQVFMFWHYMY